ncbi:MAG: 2Fe-2S iron-sulfur cluster-binding protein [Nitrospinota bacterium]|nr:2Fe-2S iron-sulfur cluster-binding protein [Nitrospinota bacterium]
MTPAAFQAAGAVIVAAVMVQVLVLLVTSFRRYSRESVQQNLALELLETQVDIAKGVFKEVQSSEFSWPGYRKFTVQRKVPEGGGVCSFYLAPHDGKPLPSFKPGQFLTFNLHFQGGGRDAEKEVVRCYSLSDRSGHADYYRVSIKKVPPPRDKPDLPPGVASSFFHDSLIEGDILDVKAPRGNFFLDTSQQSPIVLIGGGIGISPVLSMLNTIAESRSHREVWFFLGVRNQRDHIFKEHLHNLTLEHENIRLNVCYSDPTDNDVEGRDYQHGEQVSVDLFKRILPSNNYDFYICGPPPMMKSLTEGLKKWGVPGNHVHFEAFGPASVKKEPAETEKDGADAGPKHKIVFAKSNKTLPWDTSSGSIMDFALANGVNIDSGCRAGNCGTCVTAIKSGQVTYIQEPGTAPEAGTCLTCISAPNGDLTLDA